MGAPADAAFHYETQTSHCYQILSRDSTRDLVRRREREYFRKEKNSCPTTRAVPLLYGRLSRLGKKFPEKINQRHRTSVETKVKCFRGETLFAFSPILPCHLDVLRVFPRNNRAILVNEQPRINRGSRWNSSVVETNEGKRGRLQPMYPMLQQSCSRVLCQQSARTVNSHGGKKTIRTR